MSRAAFIALLLWALTVAAAAYFFFRGTTVTASDGREAVLVTTGERNQILAEMRGMLEAAAAITGALAEGNTAAIPGIALPVGTAAMAGDSPALLAKLPFGLKQLGLSVHQGFDALASAAAAGAGKERLGAMLSENLNVCVACHASYRLSE